MEEKVTPLRPLKKDLVIHLLALVGFSLLSPLFLPFEISRAPEMLNLTSVVSATILQTLLIGILASLMIGKWATSPLIQRFKDQHYSKGLVLDNQNSIFANFGFNLILGCLIGFSALEGFVCHLDSVDDLSASFTAYLNCKIWLNSGLSLIGGLILGNGLWIVYQVSLIEKDSNQKMMVQYYSTKQWSFAMIGVTAVVIFVIGLAFYKLLTLGQQS